MALTATFEADFSQFVDAVKDAQLSLTDLTASYVSAEAVIRLADAAWAAFTATLEESITAASEAEDADAQLAAALQAQGTAMPSVLAAYDAYAQALAMTTRYSDDAIKAAEAVLVQIGGVMPRDMEKALAATTNLAAGLKIDLASAATMVAKAAEGQTSALKRAGVQVEETKGQTADFSEVLTAIDAKFHGVAETMGSTFAGALDKTANAWDEVKESIGKVITDNDTVRTALVGLNDIIRGNTGELKQNATVNNLVSQAVILFAKGLSLAVEGLDYFQRELRDVRKFIDIFSLGITDAYVTLQKFERATQTPLAWAGSEEAKKRVAEATAAIDAGTKHIAALRADMEQANVTSSQWSTTLQGFRGNLDALIGRLETTTGQIHETTAAQEENAAVWTRQTNAITATTMATQEHAAATEMLSKSYIKVGTDVTAAAKAHEAAAMATISAVETTAAAAVTSTAKVAAESATAVAHFTDEVVVKASEAQAVWGGAMAGWTAGQGFAGGVGQLPTPTAGYNPETMGYAPWAFQTPSYLSGLGKPAGLANVGGVNFGAGSVVMNYPIMNDPQAMDQLGRLVGDAIISKMTRTGARV